MSLTSGARLGVYEITAALGEGGMGEVYRARDTKLNRDVALKVLPDSFASDPERRARFNREASVLASLNHHHIAQIYDFEESNGVRALVMELVEGQTLAELIDQGALGMREALAIAKQIAEALEAAHEQGIVHRDLKPANVKVRADGAVKVLDFGLAKELVPAGNPAPNLSQSPTITGPAALTGMGVLLGTAAYMAPEQAAGVKADKRSDLWAFGVVLMEMLTGRPVFSGETVSHVLASVLKTDPDWATLPATTPPPIRRLLNRCLEKDRKRRLDSAAAARLEIEEALSAPSATVVTSKTRQTGSWTTALAWSLSALLAVGVIFLVGLLGVVLWIRPGPSRPSPVQRLELNLPAGVELYAGSTQAVALSPDGTKVVFVGVAGGVRQLYLRRLDQLEATLLKGTENSNACFFSPDGNTLGVITAGGVLRKVSLADGLVVPLSSDIEIFAGGAWGADDHITFGRRGALWRMPAAGGQATQLTRLDDGSSDLHLWPAVIDDGKVILFTVVTGSNRNAVRVEALTIATGRRQVVVEPGAFAQSPSTGHLVFSRNDALLAVAFDVDSLKLTGAPVRILDNLALGISGGPIAALSNTGMLAYASSGQSTSRMTWVSRQGLEQPFSERAGHFENPRLAPDARRVVVTMNGDLWIQDIARATFTRLTSNETAGNSFPIWTHDSRRVIFRSQTGLRWIDADGSGRSEPIAGTSINDYPGSVSPDGATMAFTRITPETSGDVYTLSLAADAKPQALVHGAAYEGGPQFSPDGRWLVYASDESGTSQAYVRPFPGPDRRWLVSTQGGRQPRWNRNGKEVFYRDGNRMMAVEVTTRQELALSPPRMLFDQRYAYGIGVTTANYDVGPDQRFVMVKGESGSGRLNVVLNFLDELKARVSAAN